MAPVNEKEQDAAALEQEARSLRSALDNQLERTRSLSLEEQLELSVEEQLYQLTVLVSQYPEGALARAVLLTDKDVSNGTSYSGRLLIHLACDTNAPLEIIRWLLECDKEKQSILQKDKWGDLPIHTACSRKDVEVVRLLLESDKDKRTIFTKDNNDALPIHMACR